MDKRPRVLLTGAGGQLGAYLTAEFAHRDEGRHPVIAWSGSAPDYSSPFPMVKVELTDRSEVERQFEKASPDIVLHVAARSRVDRCLEDPEGARQVNSEATAQLVELAGRHDARLLYVSTDMVFDGAEAPYDESAVPRPLSVYGRTKREGELPVLAYPRGLVARVSLLYGPSRNGRPNFFDLQCQALAQDTPCRLFSDEWRTPVAFHSAAQMLVRLALSNQTGLIHVGGPERMTRLEMGTRLARFLAVSGKGIQSIQREEIHSAEPRPRDTSLVSTTLETLIPKIQWPRFEQGLAELGVRTTTMPQGRFERG